jgi:hypothetical protein
VVLAAVQRYGPALQYASRRLQCDLGVVVQAVKQNAKALEWASDKIKELFNQFSFGEIASNIDAFQNSGNSIDLLSI